MASLYAKLMILVFTIVHFIKRPFRKKRDGAEEFLEKYREDRLGPLSSVDKDGLFRFSQCLNCGLCDAVCPALTQFTRDQFPGPSYLVTTLTRATPDFWTVDLDFSLCQSCDKCMSVCPNQVPVKEALEFIETKLQEGQPALGSPGPYRKIEVPA